MSRKPRSATWRRSGTSHPYDRTRGGRWPVREVVEESQARPRNRKQGPYGTYADLRVMLKHTSRDVDAVVVATSNHLRAPVSLAALQAGKGVYCEKPLAHSVAETRRLAQAAREFRVSTHMGGSRALQRRSSAARMDSRRRAWARPSSVCPAEWFDRPRRPGASGGSALLPEGLHWDFWLGPARERPFHLGYAPLMFHDWLDFGSGTLVNPRCHTLDTAVWALDLEHPDLIEARSTSLSKESTPNAAIYRYRFPARGDRPPVDLS